MITFFRIVFFITRNGSSCLRGEITFDELEDNGAQKLDQAGKNNFTTGAGQIFFKLLSSVRT